MLIFKSSVLFGTHTILDKSLRVLQPTWINRKWIKCNPWVYSLGFKLIVNSSRLSHAFLITFWYTFVWLDALTVNNLIY